MSANGISQLLNNCEPKPRAFRPTARLGTSPETVKRTFKPDL
jgi:hypothetical protein